MKITRIILIMAKTIIDDALFLAIEILSIENV